MLSIDKKFFVKVFASDGLTLLATLERTVVVSEPSFTMRTGGGYGECVIDLAKPFDNFGEGVVVEYDNIFDIYEQDAANTSGRKIYRGYVSQYTPFFSGAKQGVRVTLLGLVSKLALDYYKAGASFDVTHTSVDPSVILKSIIDQRASVESDGFISYTGASIDATGVSKTYAFSKRKWLEAVGDTFELVPSGWYWTIDRDGVLQLHAKPASATHTFTIGKHTNASDIRKTAEGVVNVVTVFYTGGDVTVTDATSITRFGRRAAIITDTGITDAPTATARAQKEVDDKKGEKIVGKIELNANYDLESILPGQTCRLVNARNIGTLFNDNMQIVAVDYSPTKVVLTLEDYKGSIALADEIKSLVA